MIDPANREGRNKQREKETNFFLFARRGWREHPVFSSWKKEEEKVREGIRRRLSSLLSVSSDVENGRMKNKAMRWTEVTDAPFNWLLKVIVWS